jgi:anti-sigma-K factor RskA
VTEAEIESLLGAYALDAVDEDERAEVEAHLATCPRCRAEVAAHREVAALMANSAIAAPDGLWDRIAEELSPELPASAPGAAELLAHLPRPAHPESRHRRAFVGAIALAAAVMVVVALLSLQVSNLSQQLHSTKSAVGISAAVASVMAHEHRTITLTAADRSENATVIIGSDDEGYWIGSDLARLPNSKTYQLWTIVRGKTIVSLGVLGPDPKAASAFRLAADMGRLMVTIEPEGGTPGPTTPAVVSAVV